jgi:hypothetical protein
VVAVASLPKEIAAGLHPKQNNAIRGLLLQSGWVVEKLEDDSCMVTYVVQVSNFSSTFFLLPVCFHNCQVKLTGPIHSTVDFRFNVIQLDPAGWLPKCFVNRLNTKLVMIIENLRKLAQACPMEGDT